MYVQRDNKGSVCRRGGFTFEIHQDFENFSEAKYLEDAAEEYKSIFGFYPKRIIGDKVYNTGIIVIIASRKVYSCPHYLSD